MPNFSIGRQIKKEIEDFKKPIRLVTSVKNTDAESVRMASTKMSGYLHNLRETVNVVDLYYNSQFETGEFDKQGQRKMFLNIGKFRSDVASKQVGVAPKDFRFIPDDFADPFMAYFMQKDFKEYAKDNDLECTLQLWADKFPRYGTIVSKQVGNEFDDLPLQNIEAMDQSSPSIQKSPHFIEGHPKMRSWEIQAMPDWNITGMQLEYDKEYDVHERCGYVPKGWLEKQNGTGDPTVKPDYTTYVDARVIGYFKDNHMDKDFHVFFAEATGDDRGYREAHWSRQHGRWLGVGVIEELLENQRAKNVIVNLIRKALQWSSKRVFQAASADLAAKNLVRDVQDGEIIEVGANGDIRVVPLDAKMNADFGAFLSEWENNANQKSFTYESGLSGHSASAFRLGALLTQAAQAFFKMKRGILTGFIKENLEDFAIPQFIRDMDNGERVVSMMEGAPGFDMLKKAALDWVRTEVTRISLFTGKPIDAQTLIQAVSPFEILHQMFFGKAKGVYKNAKFKFDLVSSDDDTVDTDQVIKSLTELYQTLAQKGDPRAEQVLQRLAAVGGIYLSSADFNDTGAKPATGGAPATPEVTSPGPTAPTGQPMLNNANKASGFPTGGPQSSGVRTAAAR